MAESKIEMKGKTADHSMVGGWITHGVTMTERVAKTGFNVVRDIQSELHQRVVGTMQFAESAQQGMWKLLRTVDERLDKLAADALSTNEDIVLQLIRSFGEVGQAAAQIGARLNRPEEAARAA